MLVLQALAQAGHVSLLSPLSGSMPAIITPADTSPGVQLLGASPMSDASSPGQVSKAAPAQQFSLGHMQGISASAALLMYLEQTLTGWPNSSPTFQPFN